MLIYIIIFLWILSILALIIGMNGKQDKKIIKSLIFARLIYILLIICEVVMCINKFNFEPHIVTLSFIMTITAISFIDISFQRRIQGTLKSYIIWLTLLAIIIAIAILAVILT